VTPLFVRRLEAKKFHLLGWGNAGWVQVFSKQPIRSLADLKKLKLYVGEGSPKLERWYTTNGFHVVPLNMAQIPTQLKVPGGIEAASSVPVLANAVQIFRDAPYMLDIRVAPVTSATILSEAAWTRIAADDRPKLVQAAKDTEQRMNAQAPGLDAKAVESMKTAGLKVITLDAAALGAFHTAADGLMKTQRGDMVPADVFDAVVKARDAFRASKRAK
jgi:TRAP-type C4-dicarboxylate transport system substrate-binding protein